MKIKRSDKIRVAILENGLISSYTAREGLLKELVSKGFEVFILTHTNKYHEKVENLGVKVIHIGSANCNPINIMTYLRKLFIALFSIRPQLCLTFSVRPAIYGNIIARFFNIPVITNITGTGPLFSNDSISYKLIRSIYPFALKKTKVVFFQNEDDMRLFQDHGFVSGYKSKIIPGSGVDHQKFYPREKHPASENFTFLFIGRLIKDKGIPEFIDAARMMRSLYKNTKFKIIGPVWHQNVKSNLLSEAMVKEWEQEGVIEYLGEKDDVRQDIANADCIVLPSHREGTSNVLLEASSMQKPCIASNVPGCKEVIEPGRTGFLFEVKNCEDLLFNMIKMITLPLSIRQQMGERAREKMIREFDKKIVVAHYMNEISNILNPSPKPVFTIPVAYNSAQEFSYASEVNVAG